MMGGTTTSTATSGTADDVLLSSTNGTSGSDDDDSAEKSTGSWDMTETIVVGEMVESSTTIKEHVRVIGLEEQIQSLLAEKVETNEVIEKQNQTIEKLTRQLAEKKDLEMENQMKATVISNQEMKIRELFDRLAQSERTVTEQFYEAEAEIAELRSAKFETSTLIREIIHAVEVLRNDFVKSSDPVKTFNVIRDGYITFEHPGLQTLADKFAIHTLHKDSAHAVDFLANSFTSEKECLVEEHAKNIIRADPSLLLKSKGLALITQKQMETILKDQQIDGDEFTLFSILQKWVSSNPNIEKDTGIKLCKYIELEYIDPLKLSTTVRSSGLVSDALLCDAYGKQATRNFFVKKRVSNDREVEKWERSNIDVLDNRTCIWKTDRVNSTVMTKDVDVYEWKFLVKGQGDVILGVSSESFDFYHDDASEFGTFMQRKSFSKESEVKFVLVTLRNKERLLYSYIDGKEWKACQECKGDDGMMVTACIRGVASVKFLGFRR
jgi:hypothetical protein